MATKLTRCLCGKIYDSHEIPACPACGAAPRNEVPVAQPPPPEPVRTTSELRVPQLESAIFPKPFVRATKRGIQVNLTAQHLLRIAASLAVVIGVIAGAWWYFHRPDDDKKLAKLEMNAGAKKADSGKTDSADKTDLSKKTESGGKSASTSGETASNDKPQSNPDPKPQPKPDSSPKPDPALSLTGAKTWIVDAEKGAGSDGSEIEPVLRQASDGDTITLKPGTYAGGFVLDKKIRITGEKGEPGKFVIHTGVQKRPLRITAKGATLANLQILHDKDGKPALMLENESEPVFENCELKFRTGIGIHGNSPATFTARNCSFASAEGRVMLFRGPSKVEMTQCTFTGGSTAFIADQEVQFTLRECKFKDIGEKGTKDPAVKISGADTGITAEDCTFSGCRLPLQATEGASLTLTKCTFTGNGVPGEKGDFTQGIIAVNKKAGATMKEVTFEKNAQGINLYDGGTIQIEDCKFTNGGLLLKDAGFMNFCVPLRLYGEGAKAVVRHSTFAQSKPYAVLVEDGAVVSVEDSDFTGTQLTALIAGRTSDAKSAALSEVSVKKSRFSGNIECISLSGAKGTVDECEFLNNVSGLSASGAGTTANVTGGMVTGQKDYGFLITAEAALTLSGAKLEDNRNGVQIGAVNKPAEKASASIRDCKFSGSMDADVLALGKSKVTMRLCEFDPAEGAKVKRAKSAEIESDPPLDGIVVMGGTVKGGSTASNTKAPSTKGRTPSPPSRTHPSTGNTVRDIINTVDKVRRMFR